MARSPRQRGDLRSLDLRTVDTPTGGASTVHAGVPIDDITLAGQDYGGQPHAPELRLDVVRSVNGWHLRLRGDLELVGPCWRCLEEARVPVALDATEVSVDGSYDPELQSPYIDQGVLDLASWARDAVVEAMPPTVLCREDCRGLCPTCGANLNDGPCDCGPPPADPRWGGLADLAERLRGTEPG